MRLSAKRRARLAASAFALPAQRKYPLVDAAHVRNAAARLAQQRRRLTKAEYNRACRRIHAAARRFGVLSVLLCPR